MPVLSNQPNNREQLISQLTLTPRCTETRTSKNFSCSFPPDVATNFAFREGSLVIAGWNQRSKSLVTAMCYIPTDVSPYVPKSEKLLSPTVKAGGCFQSSHSALDFPGRLAAFSSATSPITEELSERGKPCGLFWSSSHLSNSSQDW